MKNNISKTFDKKEEEIYQLWEQSGLTNPDKMHEYLKENGCDIKKPFTITLPPPNANGDLHLGHTCGYSFHDVMGRYMRMTGHPTLLLPGKDHAGIQTESVFTKLLEKEGRSKQEMGRENFFKESYEFCMKSAENARTQEKRIGLSADYSREFFTLDPRLTEIVYDTFYKMYEDGLVYRDKRIINQCPKCRTALADVDTEHELKRGIFAYIKYPLVNKDDISNIKLALFDLNDVLINSKEGDLNENLLGVVKGLKERGIKVGILSNAVNNNPKLENLFDYEFLFGEMGIGVKPSPEVYEYVQNETGFEGGEIFFVDNNLRNLEVPFKMGWNILHYIENESEVGEYLKDGTRYITIATTRPETMLGDTAVAVNPKDVRYEKYIGHKVILPIQNREIPIIADEEVDMELGTGALKVTPAHSPIDFELGKKHSLEVVNVINEEGIMEGDIPERFKGMGTVDCSKALCMELDKEGLLVKIENIQHEVTICERCKTNIEPIISNQWYVNVKPLAEKALGEIRKGNVKVIPEGQQKALEYFYENIQPWCVSRQLWWGQRIPVWYSGGKKLYDWLKDNEGKTISEYEKETGLEVKGTGSIYLGDKEPKSNNGEIWEMEEDVFDTWYSSGQWPFSTLGGPEGEDFKKYFPTQVMTHARDILFWWSARMIMIGLYRTGEVPFNTVFLTGMILASDGSKMSKSKGNGVEPAEVFEKYGADALRLWYYSDALPGSNAPLREEKIKGNRNFVNKIWNASRFILMNIDDSELESITENNIEETERIIKTREHVKKVGQYIGKFQFNLGAETIREFFWHQLCDIWIEEIKNEIKDKTIGSEKRIKLLSELLHILKENLKIMHPFIPFITETVWQELVVLGLAKGLLMSEQMMSQ